MSTREQEIRRGVEQLLSGGALGEVAGIPGSSRMVDYALQQATPQPDQWVPVGRGAVVNRADGTLKLVPGARSGGGTATKPDRLRAGSTAERDAIAAERSVAEMDAILNNWPEEGVTDFVAENLAGLSGWLPVKQLESRTREALYSPEQLEAQAKITQTFSNIITDRAGAAQTEAEAARIKSFAPSLEDSDATLKRKARQWREFSRREAESLRSGTGYLADVPAFRDTDATATTGGSSGGTTEMGATYNDSGPVTPEGAGGQIVDMPDGRRFRLMPDGRAFEVD